MSYYFILSNANLFKNLFIAYNFINKPKLIFLYIIIFVILNLSRMLYEYIMNINILYMNFTITKKQILRLACIVRKFCIHPYNLDYHIKLFKSYDSISF